MNIVLFIVRLIARPAFGRWLKTGLAFLGGAAVENRRQKRRNEKRLNRLRDRKEETRKDVGKKNAEKLRNSKDW